MKQIDFNVGFFSDRWDGIDPQADADLVYWNKLFVPFIVDQINWDDIIRDGMKL